MGAIVKAFETEVRHEADGSTVVTHSMTLTPGSDRPIRDEVVVVLDNALDSLGGEVMHAMDPRRIL